MERVLGENDFIVSKTDAQGRITYCNKIFMDLAEFSEEELLGKPHNIIRHESMPRAVFKVLWDSIQKKRRCPDWEEVLTINCGPSGTATLTCRSGK